MKKQRTYYDVKFVTKAIEAVDTLFEQLAGGEKKNSRYTFNCRSGHEEWDFDTFSEFLAEYPLAQDATYQRATTSYEVAVLYSSSRNVKFSIVWVSAPTREEILKFFNVLDSYLPESTLPADPELPSKSEAKPRIFIGHGANPQWRDLKDHLADKHGYEVEAYEVGARAGHVIRDILEEMLTKASIAFLVLTGEDMMTDGSVHARENVIHETGLFQGRLGFARAIILLEEGTNEFSNIAGVQQIRFAKGKIKETFGDVLAVLRREFGESKS